MVHLLEQQSLLQACWTGQGLADLPSERLSLIRASMDRNQTEATLSVPFMLPVIGIKTTGRMAVIDKLFCEALFPAWR